MQHSVQHVLKHFCTTQIIILDVFSFDICKTLCEWNEQLSSVERIWLILHSWHLIQTLHHEPSELKRNRFFELTVNLNNIMCDNSFQITSLVNVCTNVVLINDNRWNTNQWFQHEILTEIIQRNGCVTTFADKLSHKCTQCTLTVVTGFWIHETSLVPGNVQSDDCS